MTVKMLSHSCSCCEGTGRVGLLFSGKLFLYLLAPATSGDHLVLDLLLTLGLLTSLDILLDGQLHTLGHLCLRFRTHHSLIDRTTTRLLTP